MTLKGVRIRLQEMACEAVGFRNKVKLNYCVENNAGDSFNRSFMKDYFNISVGKKTIFPVEHYLFCGSILGRSDENSIVIGAGLISKTARVKGYKRVVGVRGELTLERLGEAATNVFLADPGLLVREVVAPRGCGYQDKGVVGVIPHFVDYGYVREIFQGTKGVKIINIKQDYKEVAAEILQCDAVASSSLHGLIFSDSLNVPNCWVQFSDKLVGGEFKFEDYYSVCDRGKLPFRCADVQTLIKNARRGFVSHSLQYEKMKSSIIAEFLNK